jgi:hypothetical protein
MGTGKKRPPPRNGGGDPPGPPPLDLLAESDASEELEELDVDELVLLDGSAAQQEQEPRPSLTEGKESAGAWRKLEQEDAPELELDHPPPAPPPPAPPPPAGDEQGQPLPAAQEAPVAAPPPPAEVPPPPGPSLGYMGRAHAAKKPLVLFGGWFRDRARLRIAVGFAVALTLGSVIPLVHASRVMSTQVRPLLQELSNVRARGHQLEQPNYRSPEQLEAAISKVRSHHMPVTFVLWAAITAGLAFLWFRFV